MSKYIAIPFPLLEGVGISNTLLAAIVRRGMELGLDRQTELPWGEIFPRSYRWSESDAHDGSSDSLIRFTLWGGGWGFYVSGTLRGVGGHYGTSWAMEALEVKFRTSVGVRMLKTVLRMDAEAIGATVRAAYQAANPGSYAGADLQTAANAALDATLAKHLSAVEAERADHSAWMAALAAENETPHPFGAIGEED